MVRESRDLGGAEKKLTTHLLARHHAVVGLDEHVLLAAHEDASWTDERKEKNMYRY